MQIDKFRVTGHRKLTVCNQSDPPYKAKYIKTKIAGTMYNTSKGKLIALM